MISIIIVDYLAPEYTKRCIESLNKTTYKDKEIILIDNSNDNQGLAAAQNKGTRMARGNYYFFLNNDTLVKEDIFERLLESKTDVTGCRMFNYDGTKELDSGISVDKFGCPAGKTGPVFYPDGAIFIKADVFDEIGGFDEALFLYGEDRDLAWRAWLGGFTVGVNNSAVFYHNSSCVDSVSFARRRISEKNIIRSMIKNYSLGYIGFILLEYSFWSILELGLIALTKPQALWKSYFPAYWWNLLNINDTLAQRKNIVRRIPDSALPFSTKIGKFNTLLNGGVKWAKS